MYVRALTPTTETVSGPLGVGATVFTGCSSCHGTGGEGGVGYQFSQGEVLKTFPNIAGDMLVAVLTFRGRTNSNDPRAAGFGDPGGSVAGTARDPLASSDRTFAQWFMPAVTTRPRPQRSSVLKLRR